MLIILPIFMPIMLLLNQTDATVLQIIVADYCAGLSAERLSINKKFCQCKVEF